MINDKNIKKIYCEYDYTIYHRKNGDVHCFGKFDHIYLHDKNENLLDNLYIKNVKQIATNEHFFVLLTNSHKLIITGIIDRKSLNIDLSIMQCVNTDIHFINTDNRAGVNLHTGGRLYTLENITKIDANKKADPVSKNAPYIFL